MLAKCKKRPNNPATTDAETSSKKRKKVEMIFDAVCMMKVITFSATTSQLGMVKNGQ
jgi:hypothetical protein